MYNSQEITRIHCIFLYALATSLGTGELGASPAFAQCDPIPGASGPDAVSAFYDDSDPPENLQFEVFGCVNGVHAYSAEGGLCNVGTAPLPADTSTNHHAMMTQNLYRLAGNCFEQIGMSWVKHDDWIASAANVCGSLSCNYSTEAVGVGCKDMYSACSNGSRGWLGPRSQVNAATGAWPIGGGQATYCSNPANAIDCRLQVQTTDLETAAAQFFLEQQVITPDETSLATRNNNVSYKSATVESCDADLCTEDDCFTGDRPCTGSGCSCLYPLTGSDIPFCQEPAIYAWKANDSGVVETHIPVDDDGKFILAAKATAIDSCWYSYEYALYNMNSDRAADGFSVPLSNLSLEALTDIGFHDIHYHSGEEAGHDGTDWDPSFASGSITWAIHSGSTNVLRWGTLYNFRFRAPRSPTYTGTAATATIDLFESGTPTTVSGVSVAPGGSAVGACCYGGESCMITTECHCHTLSGTWVSTSSSCTAGPCAMRPGP